MELIKKYNYAIVFAAALVSLFVATYGVQSLTFYFVFALQMFAAIVLFIGQKKKI